MNSPTHAKRRLPTHVQRWVLRRVVPYLILAVGWIVITDLVLVALHLSGPVNAAAQAVKGLGFVCFLGFLIYRGLVDMAAMVEEAKDEVVEASLELVGRIGMAAEYRDDVTGGHNHRIGAYARIVAAGLGLNPERCAMLEMAAPLHDVGKIAVPDAILLKPGPLTQDEWSLMRRHVDYGVRLLADGRHPVIQMAETVAHTHHERWDGSGYPRGLRGEQIPIKGRIVAVCDTFDAMVSERPYKAPRSMDEAVAEIRSLAGSAYDPGVVDAFLACEGEIRLIYGEADTWRRRQHWSHLKSA